MTTQATVFDAAVKGRQLRRAFALARAHRHWWTQMLPSDNEDRTRYDPQGLYGSVFDAWDRLIRLVAVPDDLRVVNDYLVEMRDQASWPGISINLGDRILDHGTLTGRTSWWVYDNAAVRISIYRPQEGEVIRIEVDPLGGVRIDVPVPGAEHRRHWAAAFDCLRAVAGPREAFWHIAGMLGANDDDVVANDDDDFEGSDPAATSFGGPPVQTVTLLSS